VTSGAFSGTKTPPPQTFLYTYAATLATAAVVNILDVLSTIHGAPELDPLWPIIWEGSSWITIALFFWINWIGYRLAPPERISWRLLLHIPVALLYCVCHVGGFVFLRRIAYHLAGSRYEFGPFWTNFSYEFAKDTLTYALSIAAFAGIARLLADRQPIAPPPLTFDIRDGKKLIRVMIEDILAVSSAGNYAEFVLRDGRKPCMRSSLSAVESELAPRGFVRTHRSWLINTRHVTALEAEGSGDYLVSLGALAVPLSRRFPDALAKLRAE
jgi:hypothetical protein